MLRNIMAVALVMIMMVAVAAPAMAASAQNKDVHVTRVVVEPYGPDMNFTVYYESTFFTRLFSLIFGAKVLQPSIEDLFINFSNVSIVSIDPSSGVAKVTVKDVSRLTDDGWYVYDGDEELADVVDVIEVRNPDGKVETLNEANKLPVISNRLPSINKL
ncbi:hypothetical protein [Methanocella conradii]|uniref:hypothetical protein n=1 Tax=Methanocella conradii TaxID=1175444 RepID=UPI00157DB300|nr:hypothetical protein [Methanocella conradii]